MTIIMALITLTVLYRLYMAWETFIDNKLTHTKENN